MPNVRSLGIFGDPAALVGEVKLAAGTGITLIRDDVSNAIAIVTTPAPPDLIAMTGSLADVEGIPAAPTWWTIYHSWL